MSSENLEISKIDQSAKVEAIPSPSNNLENGELE